MCSRWKKLRDCRSACKNHAQFLLTAACEGMRARLLFYFPGYSFTRFKWGDAVTPEKSQCATPTVAVQAPSDAGEALIG